MLTEMIILDTDFDIVKANKQAVKAVSVYKKITD